MFTSIERKRVIADFFSPNSAVHLGRIRPFGTSRLGPGERKREVCWLEGRLHLGASNTPTDGALLSDSPVGQGETT